jgi:ferric-dicitrate binding protein FerR (iron transport regulator)
LVALLSYGLWQFTGMQDGTGFFAGDVDKLILNDGSLVWLRGDSKFIYYEKQDDGIRYGELTGEGLFEVAKDPDHPFIIRCGDASIKVLGTSFSLKSSAEGLELKVLTGKVSLSTQSDPEGVVVAANETVMYLPSGQILRSLLESKEVEKITKHTQYNMAFKNASLQDVLERMEDKFNVNITLSDNQAGKCTITADFTDHSLDSSLKMITEVLDVDYSQEGQMIIMSGTGCP